jgi:hypothetical protein
MAAKPSAYRGVADPHRISDASLSQTDLDSTRFELHEKTIAEFFLSGNPFSG